MWTKTAEDRLEEINLTEGQITKEQIEKISDETMVGVGIITNVLLEAIKQQVIVKK